MRYASQTLVSSERSRAEIETTLRRYGAQEFAYASRMDKAMVIFKMNDHAIRFVVPMPLPMEFKETPQGRERAESKMVPLCEQATRQRWRALVLAIKAKLECVESGISTFEDEFLAYFVMANGRTVGDILKPQIEKAASAKNAPLLLGMEG